MDSASPGGWTNVCPRVHSHKQPFPLVVKPSNPPKSDQSHFGQFLSNRRLPDEQIMQGISDGGKSGSFYQKLSYNITRNINTSMDHTRCLLIVSRKTWSCININLVVDKVCRIQADFFFYWGFDNSVSPSCILATFLPPTLQQACRCWTWPSFQNSRSSSVPAH